MECFIKGNLGIAIASKFLNWKKCLQLFVTFDKGFKVGHESASNFNLVDYLISYERLYMKMELYSIEMWIVRLRG